MTTTMAGTHGSEVGELADDTGTATPPAYVGIRQWAVLGALFRAMPDGLTVAQAANCVTELKGYTARLKVVYSLLAGGLIRRACRCGLETPTADCRVEITEAGEAAKADVHARKWLAYGR